MYLLLISRIVTMPIVIFREHKPAQTGNHGIELASSYFPTFGNNTGH